MFAEWQHLKVSHIVSIIFFSRTYMEKAGEGARNECGGEPDLVCRLLCLAV